jgi:hypothetical protein
MRMKFHQILFVLLVCLISSFGVEEAYGQEASFPGTETEDPELYKERYKSMAAPGELDPAFRKTQTTATTSLKDSVTFKPALKATKTQIPDGSKQPPKRPSQEDDSILSFNFLYYIFQKYKLQDVVE